MTTDPRRDLFFWIRQVLNVLFIIVALVGLYYYLRIDKVTGTYIVLLAMVIKMSESAVRLTHRPDAQDD